MGRKKEIDKYDGTSVAKQRLLNLFLYTDENIKEFCRHAKTYREYFTKVLFTIEEDRKKDYLPQYSDIANRVLKITEIDNVRTLNRLFFNFLSAFDSFTGYIKNEFTQCLYSELKELIEALKILSIAKTVDTKQDLDVMELLHQARNALIHSGSYICKFTSLPSRPEDMFECVPALVIIPSEIFSENYCKEHNIEEDFCLDVYEILQNFSEALDKVDLTKIVGKL